MVKGNKSTDQQIMIDPFHTPTVSGHSMGDFTSSSGSGADTSATTGMSIAAETVYYTARCAGGWRGNEYPNDKRPANEEANQHQIDYPGHSATVDERKAPT